MKDVIAHAQDRIWRAAIETVIKEVLENESCSCHVCSQQKAKRIKESIKIAKRGFPRVKQKQ